MNTTAQRSSGRAWNALRQVSFERSYTRYAEGSVLVSFGETRVLCNASVEERVPGFLRGQGQGWVTAEYSMLPRATHTRSQREASRGKIGGRTHEIQRLIGRSLRAVIDLDRLGERTIQLDCDVIQADGGTRTASITGAYLALHDAVQGLLGKGLLTANPLRDTVSAISVGLVGDQPALDLDYNEDSTAEVDMNLVMTGDGRFIEVQGTAEGEPFDLQQLQTLQALGAAGCRQLADLQRRTLETPA